MSETEDHTNKKSLKQFRLEICFKQQCNIKTQSLFGHVYLGYHLAQFKPIIYGFYILFVFPLILASFRCFRRCSLIWKKR